MRKFLYTLILILSLTPLATASAAGNSPILMAEATGMGEAEPHVALCGGSAVRVTGGSGMTLYVYNLAGVCVGQLRVEGPDRRYDLALPKGCYIIKVGKTVRKVNISR